MIRRRPRADRPARGLALLILVQAFCAVFFVGDVIADVVDSGRLLLTDVHLLAEAVAAAALVAAIVVETRVLLHMLRRALRDAENLRVAAGAFWEVLEQRFDDWGLTPAERDVATFTVKGLSVAEVARLRNAAEGTVKAQLGAVYRKAGLAGRHRLISALIEDMLNEPLVAAPRMTDAAEASQPRDSAVSSPLR